MTLFKCPVCHQTIDATHCPHCDYDCQDYYLCEVATEEEFQMITKKFKFRIGQKVLFHRPPAVARELGLPETVEATIINTHYETTPLYSIEFPTIGKAVVAESELSALPSEE